MHRSSCVKTDLNKYDGEFWCERTTGDRILHTGKCYYELWTHFVEKQWFKQNSLTMDLFLSNTQLFTSQDVNLCTGAVWITCGLLWCFYQLFGISFWRHPFTAEDPLLINAFFSIFVFLCELIRKCILLETHAHTSRDVTCSFMALSSSPFTSRRSSMSISTSGISSSCRSRDRVILVDVNTSHSEKSQIRFLLCLFL